MRLPALGDITTRYLKRASARRRKEISETSEGLSSQHESNEEEPLTTLALPMAAREVLRPRRSVFTVNSSDVERRSSQCRYSAM